jgi:biopolymer transport protein ExbB/biopolymer transport protein TolQ
MDTTPTHLWQTMGPIAQAVIVTLVVMSVACLAVAIERWRALARVRADGMARLIAAGKDVLAAGMAAPVRLEAYDRTTRRVIRATAVDARRGLALLATVGSTAPFVGLFGTVVGIVNAFHQIAANEGSGLGAVSSGIAEALVATALGIAVALPAVWFFNYLSQAISRLVADMEGAAEELAVSALRPEHAHGIDPLRS